ncbi:hypothetical protein HKX48_003125 [Thoreauomyces humboldtii]|nr:hypothetical protein HKX48_003125 [Thoreauomyces humboldtii]
MRQLADVYRDKLVFIVGPPNCKNVAHAYGFKHVILSSEMREWDRSLWPFAVRDEHKHEKTQEDLSSRPISAVMIFHDSPDWGLDIQLITDVLMSQDGRITTRQDISSERPIVQSVPLYSSAADFLWSNEWQHPRFGQGGFVRALGGVWKELSGSDLKIDTQFGKPSAATYDYAKAVMTDFAGSIPPHVYMVGDNPASDIQGANINGWKSILVETGVYRPGVKLTEAQRPTTIVNDVASAVDWILKEEGCA